MKYLVGVLAIGVAIFVYSTNSVGVMNFGGINPVTLFATTNTTKSASSTPVLALSPNTGRIRASVCNNSATVNAYATVVAGSVTSVTSTVGQSNYFATSSARLIAPATCWDMGDDRVLVGGVWVATASTTAQTLGLMEVVAQ